MRLTACEKARRHLGHRVLRVQSHDDLQMARRCRETGRWIEGARLPAGAGTAANAVSPSGAAVLRWINGRDPHQYGLDLGRWTRSVVASLIERNTNGYRQ